ncbi:MAG: ketoacyl-ACP synthase III [Bacteroidaceae bacterium]|nr:ketoacyl-ACP synthase III [Bacteroidaceae bacterium]
MAQLQNSNITIKGIVSCVPPTREDNMEYPLFSEGEAEKVILSTGIRFRRVADSKTTSSDLCYEAAIKLIDELKWNVEDIDCLIFVSQSADYILPPTSCVLQGRLGLSTNCFTLDVSYGCPGWVYGLSVISSLMQAGHMKKGLLLVGDTPTKFKSRNDKTAWPLFGDAGTATAIEYTKGADSLYFVLGADGSSYQSIMIPDGGFRNPFTSDSLIENEYGKGICRTNLDTSMDGMGVFSFGIKRAPEVTRQLMDYADIKIEDVDIFLFHQANKFMNEKIRKKIGIPAEKVPYCMFDYGNTSCATIPLTLTSACDNYEMNALSHRIVATAFGVGLAWASVYFTLPPLECLKLIEYKG